MSNRIAWDILLVPITVAGNLCNKCPKWLLEQNSSYSDYFNAISGLYQTTEPQEACDITTGFCCFIEYNLDVENLQACVNLSGVACNNKITPKCIFSYGFIYPKNQKAHIKVIKCRNQGIFSAIKGFKAEMKQFVFVTYSAI